MTLDQSIKRILSLWPLTMTEQDSWNQALRQFAEAIAAKASERLEKCPSMLSKEECLSSHHCNYFFKLPKPPEPKGCWCGPTHKSDPPQYIHNCKCACHQPSLREERNECTCSVIGHATGTCKCQVCLPDEKPTEPKECNHDGYLQCTKCKVSWTDGHEVVEKSPTDELPVEVRKKIQNFSDKVWGKDYPVPMDFTVWVDELCRLCLTIASRGRG